MTWQAIVDLFQTGAMLIIALMLAAEIRERRTHDVVMTFDVEPSGSLSTEDIARAAEGAADGFAIALDAERRRQT